MEETMLQPIGMLLCVTYSFVQASEAMLSPKAIIIALATSVAAMAGGFVAMAIHISKVTKENQEKVDELYEARINDLKEAHDLVDTLIKVLNPRKGEGGS